MQLKHQWPDLYNRLFPRDLVELDPRETKATCGDCAMAPGKHRRKVTYRADLKCCTYQPWMPNYTVGSLLSSKEESLAHARATVREFIARRTYALPSGVLPSVRYQVELNSRGPHDFGNREDWLCPYYQRDTQMCGLWKLRGSVCTSYYCQSDQGKPGLAFWKSLEDFLSYVEMALMEECLVRFDFSPRQVSDLSDYFNRSGGTAAELKSDSLTEAKSRKLWNGYFEEQEAFYRRCHEHVQTLGPAEFEEALGEQGEELLQAVLAARLVFR